MNSIKYNLINRYLDYYLHLSLIISEPACAYVYVFQNVYVYCMYVGLRYIHIQKVHMCAYFYPHVHMSVCVCIVCMCMYLQNLFFHVHMSVCVCMICMCMYLQNLILQIHTYIYRYIQYIQYMHIHAKLRYSHIHAHMELCMYLIVSCMYM